MPFSLPFVSAPPQRGEITSGGDVLDCGSSQPAT